MMQPLFSSVCWRVAQTILPHGWVLSRGLHMGSSHGRRLGTKRVSFSFSRQVRNAMPPGDTLGTVEALFGQLRKLAPQII